MRLHSDGGPLRFTINARGVHDQLGRAFQDICNDPDNRVLIMTGTGESFCADFDPTPDDPSNVPTPAFFERMFREGQDLLRHLLAIEIPVIGVINGPALIHAELPVLSDIVLMSEDAVIADAGHFIHGVVPADGVQIVWPELLGENRGRYFLLTGQRIDARQALELGVAAEVLPADQLMDRALHFARDIAAKPDRVTRWTRMILIAHLKRRIESEMGYGFALELAASAARRYDLATEA
jgi:enoyl-CoA hydratase/carnithine racemase